MHHPAIQAFEAIAPPPVPADTHPHDLAPMIGAARYAKGMMTARCPSSDCFKSRAGRLAEALRGRFSKREHAYIMSTSKARKLAELYAAGADACSYSGAIVWPGAV